MEKGLRRLVAQGGVCMTTKERNRRGVITKPARVAGTPTFGVHRAVVPKAYLRLMERCLLRPLRNAKQYADAMKLADELFGRGDLLTEEEEYLKVLCDLMEAYEAEHHAITEVSASAMLRHLIDQRGNVARETGIANSTITALLKEDRQMTTRHIRILARYFGVSPAVFLPAVAE